MTKPDMEFYAVYDAESDTNVCTGTLRVGTVERVESDALEGEAAEATKQRIRERLAYELIEWLKEYTPKTLRIHTVSSSWAVEFSEGNVS